MCKCDIMTAWAEVMVIEMKISGEIKKVFRKKNQQCYKAVCIEGIIGEIGVNNDEKYYCTQRIEYFAVY